MNSLNKLDKQDFLRQNWQKKPCVIKQGFLPFTDPIDEHDLAGLSQEPSVDSRIVRQSNNNWQVLHGPFDDINQACKGAWSLLVQGVDHYIPEADSLMHAFDFIPHWRMDDLMVSFSNKGAGVGPHLDQYDVFIIQGKGSRRWQVGLPGEFETLRPAKDLAQISGFIPVIDEVLESGDILYIPAGHPHNGVALEDCLNYSVGFRAPTQQEMLSSLADYALDNNQFTQRYTDKNLQQREFSAEISQLEIERFKSMLNDALNSEQFSHWLVGFLSENGPSLDLLEQEADFYTAEQIKQKLAAGACLHRAPAVKPVFAEQIQTSQDCFNFYIQGQMFSLPIADKELGLKLLTNEQFFLSEKLTNEISVFFAQFLSTMIHSGFWYLEAE